MIEFTPQATVELNVTAYTRWAMHVPFFSCHKPSSCINIFSLLKHWAKL